MRYAAILSLSVLCALESSAVASEDDAMGGAGSATPDLPAAAGDELLDRFFAHPAIEGSVDSIVLNGCDVVVGGSITAAGSSAWTSAAIVRWGGNAGEPFQRLAGGTVTAMAVSPDGEIYVAISSGGVFRVTASGLLAVGTICPGSLVTSIAFDPLWGDVYAAGTIPDCGLSGALNIARFDGVSWRPLGTGLGTAVQVVNALEIDAGGNLYAGGDFTSASGNSAIQNLAKWDGASWSTVVANPNGWVSALEILGDGRLVAAGAFNQIGAQSCNRICRFNGTSWAPFPTTGGGLPSFDVIQRWDGIDANQFFLGGTFNPSGSVTRNVTLWNGTAWAGVGSGVDAPVTAIAVAGNDLWIGGAFKVANPGFFSPGLVRRDMSAGNWLAIPGAGQGCNGTINDFADDGAGGFYAGGFFDGCGNTVVSNLARWNGSTWSPLGSASAVGGVVHALVRGAAGLYLGGSFTISSSTNIQLWNGTSFVFPAGQGPGGTVYDLALDASQNLYAIGAFTNAGGDPDADAIGLWNGTAWSWPSGAAAVLGGGTNGRLAFDGLGSLYVGGAFTNAGGDADADGIALWNGASFTWPTGMGLTGTVAALAGVPAGGVYAGGTFTSAPGDADARGIGKWDGAAWSWPTGKGLAFTGTGTEVLALDSCGTLLAGGRFTATVDGQPLSGLGRWDGSAWTTPGSGIGSLTSGSPRSLFVSSCTEAIAGGAFYRTADDRAVARLARWRTAPGVDLALTKAESSHVIAPGTNVTYTLTVTNSGTNPATLVTVTDALPAILSLVSATPSQGSCSGTTTITCSLGAMNPGATATVTIVATGASVGWACNEASVEAFETELDPADDIASAALQVAPSADLVLVATDTPDPAWVGQPIDFASTISNPGPSAVPARLRVFLPTALTYGSAVPSQGSCSGTTTVTCDLGSIPPSGSATVSVLASGPAPGGPVTILELDPGANDSDLSNNRVYATTTIQQGYLGDRVWSDSNGNGVQDGGEPGVAGVAVVLYSGAGAILASTTTDGSGIYSFPVSYGSSLRVRVLPPVGWTFSPKDVGGDDALDSDFDSFTWTTPLFSANGTDTTKWDAGLVGCSPPDEPVFVYALTLPLPNTPTIHYQDFNQPYQVTGWNIYRAAAPAGPWTLVGSNVVDGDVGTPNLQWTDTSGDPGSFYYDVAAYNGNCGAEGPR